MIMSPIHWQRARQTENDLQMLVFNNYSINIYFYNIIY